jgi:glycosyltransferase involved in cell wall biosynthesis
MKKVILRAPVLSRSGYGEHARFVLKALQQNPDFDIHIMPLNWGKSNWLSEDTEERREIDNLIQKLAISKNTNFDLSVQVTIPNEWQPMANVNIGICAGIETDKVSMAWIKKANEMDRVIVVSEHAKKGFTKTNYKLGHLSSDEEVIYKCETPVDVVHYGVKELTPENLDLDLKYDFNFLTVAQMGPRKNLFNTIRWFAEEFKDEEVGLVIKGHWINNSLQDRRRLADNLSSVLADLGDRTCSLHLAHGDMSDEEMHGLYIHPKIKAYLTATHGEGFGLPIFEAAYNGLPVIAPSWSGQVDFLSGPITNEKSGKVKTTALYEKVAYDLDTPPDAALWKDVIESDSKWCYPKEKKFKEAIRNVYRSYAPRQNNALKLQKHLLSAFKLEDKLTQLNNLITKTGEENETI